MRAVYAADPLQSRGRVYDEKTWLIGDAFLYDYLRIVESKSFRRLKHKTQVFFSAEGDHFRTRLTHSLEVSVLARYVCHALGCNGELAASVALAHDLGHPCFGHAGEAALHTLLEPYGGFEHNAHSYRLVSVLEHSNPGFPGLNLTWEVREGILKHSGLNALEDRFADTVLGERVHQDHLVMGWGYPGIEAQIAAIADDLAYLTHDLDDGLRYGLITEPMVEDIACLRQDLQAVQQTGQCGGNCDLGTGLSKNLRRRFLLDLVSESSRRLAQIDCLNADCVRAAEFPVIAFSEQTAEEIEQLRRFEREVLYQKVQELPVVKRAEAVITTLFNAYMDQLELLPEPWREGLSNQSRECDRARRVGDYIAGMTDAFALSAVSAYDDGTHALERLCDLEKALYKQSAE